MIKTTAAERVRRRKEVVYLVESGSTTQEIAAKLGVSPDVITKDRAMLRISAPNKGFAQSVLDEQLAQRRAKQQERRNRVAELFPEHKMEWIAQELRCHRSTVSRDLRFLGLR